MVYDGVMNCLRPKTLFTPNFNNKTTSIAAGYGIKTTLLPY
jgi:hypothetical protein